MKSHDTQLMPTINHAGRTTTPLAADDFAELVAELVDLKGDEDPVAVADVFRVVLWLVCVSMLAYVEAAVSSAESDVDKARSVEDVRVRLDCMSTVRRC